MSRIEKLEKTVHGRSRCVCQTFFCWCLTVSEARLTRLASPLCPRDLDSMDDLHFGVQQEMLYAKNTPPIPGAQWTGIVTQIAIEMLTSGKVDAVVCVQV